MRMGIETLFRKEKGKGGKGLGRASVEEGKTRKKGAQKGLVRGRRKGKKRKSRRPIGARPKEGERSKGERKKKKRVGVQGQKESPTPLVAGKEGKKAIILRQIERGEKRREKTDSNQPPSPHLFDRGKERTSAERKGIGEKSPPLHLSHHNHLFGERKTWRWNECKERGPRERKRKEKKEAFAPTAFFASWPKKKERLETLRK